MLEPPPNSSRSALEVVAKQRRNRFAAVQGVPLRAFELSGELVRPATEGLSQPKCHVAHPRHLFHPQSTPPSASTSTLHFRAFDFPPYSDSYASRRVTHALPSAPMPTPSPKRHRASSPRPKRIARSRGMEKGDGGKGKKKEKWPSLEIRPPKTRRSLSKFLDDGEVPPPLSEFDRALLLEGEVFPEFGSGVYEKVVIVPMTAELFEKFKNLAKWWKNRTRSRVLRRLILESYLVERSLTTHFIRERLPIGKRRFTATFDSEQYGMLRRLSTWWTLSISATLRYLIHRGYEKWQSKLVPDVPPAMRELIGSKKKVGSK